MKVKVVANELVDTDIEMVSLVRHGANRCPFKVLKSDEPPSFKERVDEFFSIGRGDCSVVAFFVRKDAAEKVLPLLKSEGIDIEKSEEADGVIAISVSDATPRGFIQLNDVLAVAVDQPLKEFANESVVKAYAESVGLQGFAPGVDMAVRGLADGVWSLLNSTETGPRTERVAKVDTMLASFRKYITSLAKLLPEAVFKAEAVTKAVAEEFEMNLKGKLSEAVPGDLDGLAKSEEVVAPVAEQAAPVAEVEKTEEVAAAAEAPAVEAAAAAPDMTEVLASVVAKALAPITAKIDALATDVDRQREVTASLLAKKEQVAKAERTAAARVTHVDASANIDIALSNLGGTSRPGAKAVVKSADEVWTGLFGDLDSFRPAR
jgi:hypothetical protein